MMNYKGFLYIFKYPLTKIKYMRKILVTLLALCFVGSSFASGLYAVPASSHPSAPKASAVIFPIGKDGARISLMDLSQMSIKEFETISGEKMKLGQKVG